MARRFFRLVALLVLLMIAGGMIGFRAITRPVPDGDRVEITIPPGATAGKVGQILLEKGLIRSKLGFRLILGIEGADGLLRAGDYEFQRGLSLQELIGLLVKGESVTRTFTVPEGFTVTQIADLLCSSGLVDAGAFLTLAREAPLNTEYLPEGQVPAEPMEGYLFPETYRVPRGVSAEDILTLMYQEFERVFSEEFRNRASEIGLSVHEVLTLASIIEREAVKDEERGIISGVYHNRLRINMKLDADPTVLYAHGRRGGLVSLEDLKVESPYNTYRYPGLPPGPIASPGEASIRAALYPEEVDYLYFVSRNDGTHVFSRTYSEHLKNQAEYQSKS